MPTLTYELTFDGMWAIFIVTMFSQFTFRQRLLLVLAGVIGPTLIRLLGSTWRVAAAGSLEWLPQKHPDSRRIYCFWHNRLLGLCYTQRNKTVGILISTHFDGEVMARIVTRMGYRPLRGSSTREGAAGLLAMLRDDSIWNLAITVDGPRGPRCEVKPGALYLAAKSGLPIVPVTCEATRKWVLSSWDHFEIPKPFARVTVKIGEPIYTGSDVDGNEIEKQAARLKELLNEMGSCS